MTDRSRALTLSLTLLMAACSDKPSTPTTPSSTQAQASGTTVTAITVTGNNTFTRTGATAQFLATATVSDGPPQDHTSTATWQSDNAAVATVSTSGLVTAVAPGEAVISATVTGVRGTRSVTVTNATRTPDPPAGQRLSLPDVRAFIIQTANARPDLMAQSCPNGRKYENNPWLDYMVDALRTLDTRWGYNGKPTRGPADNNGFPVIAAGDEIAYHYGSGSDQGSRDVYLIDILAGHCGPTPSLTYREFTGEEPGFWTGAGRLR